MVIALGIVTSLAVLRAVIYKLGSEGLILYMVKKQYTPPSKGEMMECQQEILKRKFKWYRAKSR